MRRMLAHTPAVTSWEGTYYYSKQIIEEMHSKILDTVRNLKDDKEARLDLAAGFMIELYVAPVI